MAADEVERAVTAIRAGSPCCSRRTRSTVSASTPYREEAARRLYRLKGRDDRAADRARRPDHEMLFECVPELRGRCGGDRADAASGPVHARLPEPCPALPWLTGDRPESIGVRVPELPDAARRVVERSACVAATSANDGRAGDPASLDDVPRCPAPACAAALDAGRLPGTPSTVLDFTSREPVVLRQGAASAAEAFERVRDQRSSAERPRSAGALPRREYDPSEPEKELTMAIAQETFEHLKTAGLAEVDPEIAELLGRELERQRKQIELIASENFTWPCVLEAVGSTPTNKYAEGYPGQALLRRVRGRGRDRGARARRAKELFGAEHANVQPHAGAQANMAVYFAVL